MNDRFQDFLAGARVFAPWEAHFLYVGTIEQVRGNEALVRFDDGDRGWVQIQQIRPLEVHVGLRVSSRWKTGRAYYPGKVTAVEGERVHIGYDDGDREWTRLAALRIPCAAIGPNARPTSSSGPNASPRAWGWMLPVAVVLVVALLLGMALRKADRPAEVKVPARPKGASPAPPVAVAAPAPPEEKRPVVEKKKAISVLFFSTTWCGASQEFAPTFERWSRAHSANNVHFKKVDAEREELLASTHRISHVPTVVVLHDGAEVARFVGNDTTEAAVLAHLR